MARNGGNVRVPDTDEMHLRYNPVTAWLRDDALILTRRIRTEIRWAYYDGYQMTKAAKYDSEPVAMSASLPEPVAQGSRSRIAYSRAVRLISIAECRLAWSLQNVIGGQQPPLRTPHRNVEVNRVVKCLDGIAIRAKLLYNGWPLGRQDDPSLEPARRAIMGPCYDAARIGVKQALQDADAILVEAMRSDVTETPIPQVPLCGICGIRALEAYSGISHGRCHTCAVYFIRNGVERPRALDTGVDIIADARSAAARRLGRDEGYGHS